MQKFTCYVHEGWDPRIRPAPATRPWMDATPDAFAYRCLPLNIANAHGWEILSPCTFEASWNGGSSKDDVTVRILDNLAPASEHPVPLFGQGTVTFHIQGIFRTPPGWNLWITGSPNRPKDGISPLSAVVETDWAPYTFTMNWIFTRRNHTVRFLADEPICFVFPVQRTVLETLETAIVPMSQAPKIAEQFAAWSASRNAFQTQVTLPGTRTADTWQKRYYRGLDMNEKPGVRDHLTKLRLRPFVRKTPE